MNASLLQNKIPPPSSYQERSLNQKTDRMPLYVGVGSLVGALGAFSLSSSRQDVYVRRHQHDLTRLKEALSTPLQLKFKSKSTHLKNDGAFPFEHEIDKHHSHIELEYVMPQNKKSLVLSKASYRLNAPLGKTQLGFHFNVEDGQTERVHYKPLEDLVNRYEVVLHTRDTKPYMWIHPQEGKPVKIPLTIQKTGEAIEPTFRYADFTALGLDFSKMQYVLKDKRISPEATLVSLHPVPESNQNKVFKSLEDQFSSFNDKVASAFLKINHSWQEAHSVLQASLNEPHRVSPSVQTKRWLRHIFSGLALGGLAGLLLYHFTEGQNHPPTTAESS